MKPTGSTVSWGNLLDLSRLQAGAAQPVRPRSTSWTISSSSSRALDDLGEAARTDRGFLSRRDADGTRRRAADRARPGQSLRERPEILARYPSRFEFEVGVTLDRGSGAGRRSTGSGSRRESWSGSSRHSTVGPTVRSAAPGSGSPSREVSPKRTTAVLAESRRWPGRPDVRVGATPRTGPAPRPPLRA